jgi:DNA-binding FadR family transcriptional regulator
VKATRRQPAGVELADEIEKEIRSGKHHPGAVLGFENELISRHGAGRAVVRQAVRILEQRGVAYSRRGKGGGLVVTAPKPDSAIRALSIVIGSQFADFTDISALVSAADNHQFLNCAGRADPLACRQLQLLVEKFETLSADEFLQTNAHGQVLHGFIDAFRDPAASLAQHTANACGIDLVPYAMSMAEARYRGEFWELTRQLVDALLGGNVRLMFELRMQQWRLFSAKWSSMGNLDRVRERVPPKIEDKGSAHSQALESSADRLAREILRDIRQLGWRVGERIGGADELMSRYGTSPHLLRQAVCILEEYSAVYMQRGRSGGLLVAAPDEGVAVQRAVSYLRWANANPADLHLFLVQIVLEALNRSQNTLDRKSLPELRAVIDRARVPDAKRDARAKYAPYLAITRLSNSPAMQLFARLLVACLPERVEKRPAQFAQGHALLDEMFDSVITGNTPKARRAFLQYADQDARPDALR